MAFEHYDKCSLLLPMDGANNGTTFTDWSPVPKTVSVFGNTKTLAAQSKYYGSSGYFDGTGDYLSTAANSAFEFGSGGFTIAAWVYFTVSKTTAGQYSCIVSKEATGDSNNRGWQLSQNGDQSGKFIFVCRSGTTAYNIISTTIPAVNTWYYVAVTRSGSNLQLAVNGVIEAATTIGSAAINNNSTYNQYVGLFCNTANTPPATNESYFNGYIQDLLVIKGAALWTSNFTPPTRLIGQISGTVTDINGAAAARTVSAFPRCNPTRIFQTTSSAVDGAYSLRVPATEVTRVAFAQETSVYNDLVARIIPE